MKKSAFKTTARLLSYIKRYIPILIMSVIFAALSSILGLYIPRLIGNAIDFAVGENTVNIQDDNFDFFSFV